MRGHVTGHVTRVGGGLVPLGPGPGPAGAGAGPGSQATAWVEALGTQAYPGRAQGRGLAGPHGLAGRGLGPYKASTGPASRIRGSNTP